MFVWSVTFQTAQEAMKNERWRTRSAGGKVFFRCTECRSSTRVSLKFHIKYHIFTSVSSPFLHIKRWKTAVSSQMQCLCSILHHSAFSHQSAPPTSKHVLFSAPLQLILSQIQTKQQPHFGETVQQVYKLIHWDCPVNRNPCSAARGTPTNPPPLTHSWC